MKFTGQLRAFPRFIAAFFAVAVFGGLGCGSPTGQPLALAPAATACKPGIVEIQVSDTYLQLGCGCSFAGETNGTQFPTKNTLTCHVASSSPQPLVFFYFVGTLRNHQIVSSLGSPSFPASGLSNPNSDYPIRVHAVTLSQSPAVYSFEDVFTGLNGQIFIP